MIGGREYFVQGREETAPKGLARAWIITTADQSRTYRWRPFRGLELLNGELVRPRRRRKSKAAVVAAPPPPPPRQSLWRRLLAFFGLGRKGPPMQQNQPLPEAPGEDIPEGAATTAHGQ
jgi:hypothetical protein